MAGSADATDAVEGYPSSGPPDLQFTRISSGPISDGDGTWRGEVCGAFGGEFLAAQLTTKATGAVFHQTWSWRVTDDASSFLFGAETAGIVNPVSGKVVQSGAGSGLFDGRQIHVFGTLAVDGMSFTGAFYLSPGPATSPRPPAQPVHPMNRVRASLG